MYRWMGLHIFDRDFGMRMFRQLGTSNREDFYYIKCNKCANSFQDDLNKRLYKVDA